MEDTKLFIKVIRERCRQNTDIEIHLGRWTKQSIGGIKTKYRAI
jgi:hypothetical protein